MFDKLEWQRKTRLLGKNKWTKRYEKTEKGFLVRCYRNMLSRVKGISPKRHLYKGKEILDRESFYEWSLKNEDFKNMFTKWKDSGHQRILTPSIDRIDTSMGYSLKNMRWVTFSENCKSIKRNTKKRKIVAIGDVHGCYKTMMSLYKKIVKSGIDPHRDTFVWLGDFIDRGSRTKQVIDQLIKWEKEFPHWVFLTGNHESLMLDALVYKGRQYHSYDLWWMQGGKETAQSYIPQDRSSYEKAISSVKDSIPYEHLKWLIDRPYYFDTKDYFFVHGGVIPGTSLEDLKKKLDEPLSNDEKQAVIWARDLFIDCEQDWGKKIIFGHTATKSLQNIHGEMKYGFYPIIQKNKIGIDLAVCPSACNQLCALELPSETFYFQDYVD